jgi:phage baseplate assembly protein V
MIEIIKSLEGRIAALEEAMKNVLRVGVVVERQVEGCTVRVQFPDNAATVSYWCRVLARKTHLDKEFWLPDLGELVACVFLPFGHEQGFVLGAVYNAQDLAPEEATDHTMVIKDRIGNLIMMDRETGIITIHAAVCVEANLCPNQ